MVGVILSPLGIVIGLLAGAGVLIAKNWDKVAPKLMKFWDGLKDRASKAWEGTKRLWGQAQPYLSRVWSRVSDGAVRAGTMWQMLHRVHGRGFPMVPARSSQTSTLTA
ncbi:hypothetical protein HGG75_05070 [Ochrobactrum pseudogrignonense]|nr:hypothetical protein [Brucella pseudogrignonensis]